MKALQNKDNLTDYERQNVLNYLGFVYYNMDDINSAMQIYDEMLQIPTMEEQIRKQTIYTLSQLNTMQENYDRAIQLIEEYFVLETNPASGTLHPVCAEPVSGQPICGHDPTDRNRDGRCSGNGIKRLKKTGTCCLTSPTSSRKITRKVRDIQKILLVNWPKKRYWFSLAGAYTELGEDNNLIYAYDAAHTQGMLEKESELVTMAQLYMQAEVPYKAATLLDSKRNEGRARQRCGEKLPPPVSSLDAFAWKTSKRFQPLRLQQAQARRRT